MTDTSSTTITADVEESRFQSRSIEMEPTVLETIFAQGRRKFKNEKHSVTMTIKLRDTMFSKIKTKANPLILSV